MVFVLRLYRLAISPLFGPVCRFHPSCSRYAEGCLLAHGPVRGTILTIKRLAKCHPFHPGGYDPVPPRGHRGTPNQDPFDDRQTHEKQLALAVTTTTGQH